MADTVLERGLNDAVPIPERCAILNAYKVDRQRREPTAALLIQFLQRHSLSAFPNELFPYVMKYFKRLVGLLHHCIAPESLPEWNNQTDDASLDSYLLIYSAMARSLQYKIRDRDSDAILGSFVPLINRIASKCLPPRWENSQDGFRVVLLARLLFCMFRHTAIWEGITASTAQAVNGFMCAPVPEEMLPARPVPAGQPEGESAGSLPPRLEQQYEELVGQMCPWWKAKKWLARLYRRCRPDGPAEMRHFVGDAAPQLVRYCLDVIQAQSVGYVPQHHLAGALDILGALAPIPKPEGRRRGAGGEGDDDDDDQETGRRRRGGRVRPAPKKKKAQRQPPGLFETQVLPRLRDLLPRLVALAQVPSDDLTLACQNPVEYAKGENDFTAHLQAPRRAVLGYLDDTLAHKAACALVFGYLGSQLRALTSPETPRGREEGRQVEALLFLLTALPSHMAPPDPFAPRHPSGGPAGLFTAAAAPTTPTSTAVTMLMEHMVMPLLRPVASAGGIAATTLWTGLVPLQAGMLYKAMFQAIQWTPAHLGGVVSALLDTLVPAEGDRPVDMTILARHGAGVSLQVFIAAGAEAKAAAEDEALAVEITPEMQTSTEPCEPGLEGLLVAQRILPHAGALLDTFCQMGLQMHSDDLFDSMGFLAEALDRRTILRYGPRTVESLCRLIESPADPIRSATRHHHRTIRDNENRVDLPGEDDNDAGNNNADEAGVTATNPHPNENANLEDSVVGGDDDQVAMMQMSACHVLNGLLVTLYRTCLDRAGAPVANEAGTAAQSRAVVEAIENTIMGFVPRMITPDLIEFHEEILGLLMVDITHPTHTHLAGCEAPRCLVHASETWLIDSLGLVCNLAARSWALQHEQCAASEPLVHRWRELVQRALAQLAEETETVDAASCAHLLTAPFLRALVIRRRLPAATVEAAQPGSPLHTQLSAVLADLARSLARHQTLPKAPRRLLLSALGCCALSWCWGATPQHAIDYPLDVDTMRDALGLLVNEAELWAGGEGGDADDEEDEIDAADCPADLDDCLGDEALVTARACQRTLHALAAGGLAALAGRVHGGLVAIPPALVAEFSLQKVVALSGLGDLLEDGEADADGADSIAWCARVLAALGQTLGCRVVDPSEVERDWVRGFMGRFQDRIQDFLPSLGARQLRALNLLTNSQ
ncbi:hypothetical protein PAPYR_6547 [Paratrimastix pyriformis]|uniref:Uncharacterized protein n=1 Tax=Paratrimastix pyriformis TaxID=342808 RepID=A0ABQ8UF06_9EUKA|nr:hypothetical protein PAPYR_6547 [Paratrimastix pyriformis]